MVSDLFQYKKGSPNRGLVWDSIVENLNKTETPVFTLKDKRSVRDRWSLLKAKFKQKMREEERASGIDVDKLSEKESLIEELCQKEDSFLEVASVQKQKENANAIDIRMTALERMGETSKRKSDGQNSDVKLKKVCRGSCELVEYLRERSSKEIEIHRAELEVKQNEQEIQNQLRNPSSYTTNRSLKNDATTKSKNDGEPSFTSQQQQQLSTAFLDIIQRFTTK
ncbi:uncharacterized protein LOC124456945 [Xenia sp. Carnegie-2017]|uniref:uncharacterized protein LOC124456945 n=1 Tax=Xenia sp. Carnegie-2017 TaxID=2897299 RepID=UPI001F04BDEE|nr:uncharacterized protein LOC124456945 [Xenia sp. Carnegie-2017]